MLCDYCWRLFSLRPRRFTLKTPRLSWILLDVLGSDNQLGLMSCALRPNSFRSLLL